MTDPAPAQRGDKFGALQEKQQQQNPVTAPKRDKFAAMQSRNSEENAAPSLTSLSPSQEPKQAEQVSTATLQNEKFSKVWNDLQLAEAATLKLLQLARETAESLTQADTLDDNQQALPPTDEFLESLQSIHSRLAPHAFLVKAYQAPTEPNQTYLAKVELGMARQKRNVIQAWNHQLKNEGDQDKHESILQNVAAVGGCSDASSLEVGSKRKRDNDSTN
ncbi:hypothetical protein MPSEU_000816300 [Mayamaea pseudoterrestris]|nr:hypothetical protein MPSEU_000816300 [Mayamaea pseudoterrestris]